MAQKQIKQYTEETSVQSGDWYIMQKASNDDVVKVAGSNILPSGAVTNAKLSTTTGELGGAWASWTPTWTNLTVGNGTVTARYMQIGKTIIFRINLVFGSTTSITGVPTFTLPVTSLALVGADSQVIGVGKYLDSGTAAHNGFVMLNSTTTGQLQLEATSGTYGLYQGVTSTTPFTWTTNDEIKFHDCVYQRS